MDEEAWRALNDTRASSMALFLAHSWQPSWWSRVVVVAVVVIVVTLLSFSFYRGCTAAASVASTWGPQVHALHNERPKVPVMVLISPNATRAKQCNVTQCDDSLMTEWLGEFFEISRSPQLKWNIVTGTTVIYNEGSSDPRQDAGLIAMNAQLSWCEWVIVGSRVGQNTGNHDLTWA